MKKYRSRKSYTFTTRIEGSKTLSIIIRTSAITTTKQSKIKEEHEQVLYEIEVMSRKLVTASEIREIEN